MKFAGKNVLVTGANRGIGLATLRQLLQSGVGKVYAAARNPDSIPDLRDDRVVPVRLDITNADDIAAATDAASDLDVLINNAGVASFGSLLDAPLNDIERDMNVNYYATLNVIRAFAPILEARDNATIVNVVTIAAFVNFPSLGGYSASKAALFSLSQGLRMELAQRGITVHTVNPGPIDTDMAKEIELDKTSPEEAARNLVAGIESGEADILPDAAAENMFSVWKDDYRKLEQAVKEMHFSG